jgi:hypothetical protein
MDAVTMRIRTIKPEFWRSEDIKALPRDVRLLFIGLWSYVDDNGVGVDDNRQIAADLFALEDDPLDIREYVREGLATLSRAGLIVRYGHGGKRYLFPPAWDKHQRIDRPGKPRYPRPDETLTSENVDGPDRDAGLRTTDQQTLARPSRGSRETLDQGSKAHGAGKRDRQPITDAPNDIGTDTPTDADLSDHPRSQRSDQRKRKSSRDPRETLATGTGEQGNRGTDKERLSHKRDLAPTDVPGKPKPQRRGTRIPDDFVVTDAMVDWAEKNAPNVDVKLETAKFVDYWTAESGTRATKRDWVAAWRVWMRKAVEYGSRDHRPSPNGHRPAGPIPAAELCPNRDHPNQPAVGCHLCAADAKAAPRRDAA